MKRFTCAVFALTSVLAGIQPLPAQVQGQWTGTGAMQSTRELDAQVRLISGRVLAMGGVDNSNTILSSAEVYNPGPGTWTLTGSMSAARNLFPAVVLTSGKVLVAGGLGTGGAVLAGAELYNPTTGIWSSAGELSVARFGHTATLLQNGKVLVAGGCTTNNCNADTAVSELYDPTSNSWSKTGSLNTARYYHAAVRLNSGKVLVIAGSTGGATNSCELYDPSEGTWSNAASTTTARFYHAATLLADGKVLVTGGAISRYPLNSAELYNPSTNAWALTGSMTTGRYAHTATLLTDNTVLVAGGEGQSISCGKACTSYIPTAKADIYNEAAGKFTATSSLSRARAYHSATLLGTGRVLVDSGVGYNAYCCIVLGSAESYTALTLTFSASTLTFGVFQIGLTSPSQTVTVTNASSHSATFSSITTSGDFSQSNTCPATLNSGQNCTITVVFKPTAAGTRTGNVILKDNCPGSPMQTIALTGTGAANALTLLANPLRFPATIPGNSSGPMNITLYNDGAAAVHIIGMAIAPNDGTFTVTGSNCPATLNPNTNCAIQVLFTPPDAGNYSETLSVTDSDKSSPQTASLTGTGLD